MYIIKTNIYSSIIAILFYFFLISTIFNPFINNKTLYLYGVLPFLDLNFLLFIKNYKIKKKKFLLLLGVFCLLLSDLELFIRALIITLVFLYLKYSYINKRFYLYIFFILSSFLAFIQFIFLFIDPNISYMIGPTNLSRFFLGEYAGPTFTNFYEIFFLPRVSGLSREGGFFASLVVVMFLIYYLDKVYSNKYSKIKFILLIDFLISLSKSSFGIISILIIKFKILNLKLLFKVTMFFIIYIMSMIFIISPFIINYALSHNGDTFLHRFGGYYLMQFVDIREFLFGHIDMSHYKNLNFVNRIWSFVKDGNWTGWSFVIVKIGFINTILIILLLECLGFSLLDFLLLTLLTFNTNPLAITNQVVLLYFVIFFLLKKKESYYANN